MSDKKNNTGNVSTRLAGAAILMVAVTGVPALAQTGPDDRVVTITNRGTDAMVLGKPEWPRGFTRGAPIPEECGQVVPVGGHCKLPIRFVPTQVGPYAGDLIIPVNSGNEPSLVVHLTGTGIAK